MLFSAFIPDIFIHITLCTAGSVRRKSSTAPCRLAVWQGYLWSSC